MSAGRMHQETFDVLRHLEVHGPRTKDEIKKAFADRPAGHLAATVNNLVTLGYLAPDDTTKTVTFTLTGKARKKLAAPNESPNVGRSRLLLRTLRDPALVVPSPRMPDAKAWKPPAHVYAGKELAACARTGAMDAFAHPSRMGNRLHFRDGRVTDMAGNPITTT